MSDRYEAGLGDGDSLFSPWLPSSGRVGSCCPRVILFLCLSLWKVLGVAFFFSREELTRSPGGVGEEIELLIKLRAALHSNKY